MTKEYLLGQDVILADEVLNSYAKAITLYKIIDTSHIGDETVYTLQRAVDDFILGRHFTHEELIPASESSEKETEAPSTYHDKHYNGCIIEPILLMQWHLTKEQFEGFLLGNIIKYRVRAGHKDDAKKDIDKAMRYEQWLREFQEKGTITL